MGSNGAVVVARVCAHGAARDSVFAVGHACGGGDIGESSVAVVAVEFIGLRVVGFEYIRPAIAVVVQDGDAQGLGGGIGDAGLRAHFLKTAAAQVVKQAAALA